MRVHSASLLRCICSMLCSHLGAPSCLANSVHLLPHGGYAAPPLDCGPHHVRSAEQMHQYGNGGGLKRMRQPVQVCDSQIVPGHITHQAHADPDFGITVLCPEDWCCSVWWPLLHCCADQKSQRTQRNCTMWTSKRT